MKSNVEEVTSVQKKISITVPHEKVNTAFNEAYKRYQKKTRIRGFRPGKAPLYLIKNNYAGEISYEVSDSLLGKCVQSAIEEHKIQPISRPQITSFNQPVFDKDFSFTAVVEVFPKIPLGETYKALEANYSEKAFDEKEVEEELTAIQRHYAKTSPIESSDITVSEKDQLVVVTFESFNGEEKLDRLSSASARAAMGFDELPKEIEAALVGMKKGEKKELGLTFSEDTEFSEKELKVSISLEDILTFTLPELNDDFAKELKMESMAAVKGAIKENLEQKVENANRSNKEGAILKALGEKVSFDVPPVILNQVIDGMIEEVYGSAGASKEALQSLAKDKSFREKLVPEATKRATNTLLLWEVAKAEKIEVSDEDIKGYIRKSLGANADEKKVNDLFSNSKDRINETLVFEKALAVMADSAQFKVEKA